MSSQKLLKTMKKLRISRVAELLEDGERKGDTRPLETRFVEAAATKFDESETEKLAKRLRGAALKYPNADLEDFWPGLARGICRDLIKNLGQLRWVGHGQSLFVFGAPRAGKSWLASGLGVKAVRANRSVKYFTLSALLLEFNTADFDGKLDRYREQLAAYDVLIVDDCGGEPLLPKSVQSWRWIVEDRVRSRKSIVVVSSKPLAEWSKWLSNEEVGELLQKVLTEYTIKIHMATEATKPEVLEPVRRGARRLPGPRYGANGPVLENRAATPATLTSLK